MSSKDYWARRYKAMEEAILDKAYADAENLEKQFNTAIHDIDVQMRVWYQRFAKNNDISIADARRMLTTGELDEFKWTVEEYIKKGRENNLSGEWLKELENASARVHISRLDSLKMQLRQKAEELAAVKLKATEDAASLAYTESYYHTAFEFQKKLGYGWTMQALDENALKKVLSKPWTADGKTFKARCWEDKAKLVETVNRELTRMIATGAAPDKAIERIAKIFNTSKTNAGKLVMTESAFFASTAQKDSFTELGVEQYKIVGTLDGYTCDVCGDMDSKVFDMKDFAPGSTAPPFHPWCRCATCPYFADMEGLGERFARDVETGERYKVPGDMTYKQWKAKQDEQYGEGTVDKKRRMSYNKVADEKQFSAYKKRLDAEAPKTFAEFQQLKYENVNEYTDLCGRYSYKGRVPESTASDYRAYKAIKATGVKGTVRVPPQSIDATSLVFNDEHAGHHGCTLEDAISYVQNARCSIVRKRWDGYSVNYYSDDGATYIDKETQKIKTAFPSAKYDPATQKIMEVFR